jgi:hypothetical protein
MPMLGEGQACWRISDLLLALEQVRTSPDTAKNSGVTLRPTHMSRDGPGNRPFLCAPAASGRRVWMKVKNPTHWRRDAEQGTIARKYEGLHMTWAVRDSNL